MGYQAEMNHLRAFHGVFKGRRLEFEGVAVKRTICETCNQLVSPVQWQLHNVHGGPYVIPEGAHEDDVTFIESEDGAHYELFRSGLDHVETDGLPPGEGRVRFTAIVQALEGYGDSGLDKIEYLGGVLPASDEPPF